MSRDTGIDSEECSVKCKKKESGQLFVNYVYEFQDHTYENIEEFQDHTYESIEEVQGHTYENIEEPQDHTYESIEDFQGVNTQNGKKTPKQSSSRSTESIVEDHIYESMGHIDKFAYRIDVNIQPKNPRRILSYFKREDFSKRCTIM